MAELAITVQFFSITTFFACQRSEICMFFSGVTSPSIMALLPVSKSNVLQQTLASHGLIPRCTKRNLTQLAPLKEEDKNQFQRFPR
jgi:hypothetical protein